MFVTTDFENEIKEHTEIRISTGGTEFCMNWDTFRKLYGKSILNRYNVSFSDSDINEKLDSISVPKGYQCQLDPEF